jgi:hypothetical protein
MQAEETPDREPEEPQKDHHFGTPVVREARPAQGTDDERDDEDDAGAEQRQAQERELAFQRRWENVQTAFLARGRSAPQARLRD